MDVNILIVDDKSDNLSLLSDILSGQGYRVRVSPNGVHALATVEKEKPNLILLDILMPRMNGYEVCKKLKEDKSTWSIPVIFMTALNSAEHESQGFRLGAVDYITKPFNPDLVLARVKTQLHLQAAYHKQHELLEKTLEGSISLLTDIIELSYPEIFNLTKRTTGYIEEMVKFLGLENPWLYRLAGHFSQVGCITLSPEILKKSCTGTELSEEEKKVLANHPQTGRDLVMNIPHLKQVAEIISIQDKSARVTNLMHFDEEVILGGNILKVALDYEHKTNSGMSSETAIIEMLNDTDQYFSKVINALEKTLIKKVTVIKKKSRLISKLRDLEPGMVLSEKVVSKRGKLLLSSGSKITKPAIKRLEYYVGLRDLEPKFYVLD